MNGPTPHADRLIQPNGFHSLGAECPCGWLERDCQREQNLDGDSSGHERRLEERELTAEAAESCPHPLVELLSINGRNLDGAVRQCAACGEHINKEAA